MKTNLTIILENLPRKMSHACYLSKLPSSKCLEQRKFLKGLQSCLLASFFLTKLYNSRLFKQLNSY